MTHLTLAPAAAVTEAPAAESVANVSGPIRILPWINVRSRTCTEALVDCDRRTLTLIAQGPVGTYTGGCCVGDILHVKGVRVANILICEAAELAWCAMLEPGPTPVVIGYREPTHRQMPRAA